MAEGKRRGWRLGALAALSALILACQSTEPRRSTTSGAGLDEGPTRWLMLPDEERQYHRLRTTREVVDFIEEFWRRRDPEPDKPGNPFAKTFYERVEAADHLYSEGGTRGSLTDRGRALVLLGPPPVLRYGQKKVPTWNAGRPGAPSAVQTQTLPQETWVYSVPELPPTLQQLILDDEGGPVAEITLVFTADPEHTDLIDGEKYLKMAARAAVQR